MGKPWSQSMNCSVCHVVRNFVLENRILYCEVCDPKEYQRIKWGNTTELPKIVKAHAPT